MANVKKSAWFKRVKSVAGLPGPIVVVNRWDNLYRSLNVYASERASSPYVIVTQDVHLDTLKPCVPQVSFPSYGSMPLDVAVEFQAAIARAIDLAKQMANCHAWEQRFTLPEHRQKKDGCLIEVFITMDGLQLID